MKERRGTSGIIIRSSSGGKLCNAKLCRRNGNNVCLWNNWPTVQKWGDAGLNPHDNYSGWSAAFATGLEKHYLNLMTSMEPEPWLATSYEFVDETTVKITLRENVYFSSGRLMDAQAVKECLDDLNAVHDRAPSDMKIESIEADGMTVLIHTSEPCPSIINYLGDPYGAIIDMQAGIEGRRRKRQRFRNRSLYCRRSDSDTDYTGEKRKLLGWRSKNGSRDRENILRWKCFDSSFTDRRYSGNLWTAV